MTKRGRRRGGEEEEEDGPGPLIDALRSLLQRADELEASRLTGCESAALAGTSEGIGRPGDAIGKSEMLRVCKMIEKVAGSKELKEVEGDLLVGFVKVLTNALLESSRDPRATNDQLDFSEAILTVVCVGNGQGLDHRLLSQEVLESVVHLCKSQMVGSLFPSIDPEYSAKTSGVQVSRNKSRSNSNAKGKRKRKAAAGSKKGRKRRKRRNSGGGGGGDDDDDEEEEEEEEEEEDQDKNDDDYHLEDDDKTEGKSNRTKEQKLSSNACIQLSTSLCRVLIRLNSALVTIPKLEDELLLQVSSLCVSSFSVDVKRKASLASHVMQIQQACIDVLRSIFRHQRQHREFILEEIIDCIVKLPRSKGSLRTYHVEAEESIQIVSALILEVVQCVCVSVSSDGEDGVSCIPNFAGAQKVASSFLQKLLEKCGSPAEHADDEDTKQCCSFLGNFVEDMLTVLYMPEWPAAEVLLKFLGQFISKYILTHNQAKEKKDSGHKARFGMQALSLFGSLLARIQAELSFVKNNKIKLPVRRDETHSSTADTCPICGESTRSGAQGKGEGKGDGQGGEQDSADGLTGDVVEQVAQIECGDCGDSFHLKCLAASAQHRSFRCDDCIILAQLENNPFPFQFEAFPPGSNADESIECADTAAFRQLFLNFLFNSASNGSASSQFAYEFHLSMWKFDDRKRSMLDRSHTVLTKQWLHRVRVDGDDGVDTSDGEPEPAFLPPAALNSSNGDQDSQAAPGRRSVHARTQISRIAASAILRQLAATSAIGFCSESAGSHMLSRLLCILGVGIPSFRARAIKALGTVIEADTALMKDERVKTAVELRVMDEAISVREASLELVGKYILARPDLISAYQDTLVQRLSDLGLSVRKRVLKIFRDVLLVHNEDFDRASVHQALAMRIEDANEDDSVRDMVVSIFRDLWFSVQGPEPKKLLRTPSDMHFLNGARRLRAPSRTLAGPNKQAGAASLPSSKTPMQAVQSEQMRRQSSSFHLMRQLSQTGYFNLDPSPPAYSGPTDEQAIRTRITKDNAADIILLVGLEGEHEWFVTMLKSVLHPKTDASADAAVNGGDAAAIKVCAELVEHLVNRLLELQDEDADLVRKTPDGHIVRVNIEEDSFKVLRTLELFSEAFPRLLNPFMDTFLPYLKPESLQVVKADRDESICILLRIVAASVGDLRVLDAGFVQEIQASLQCLVYAGSPPVMLAAIRCLGAVAGTTTGNDQCLIAILNRFLGFLGRFAGKPTMQGVPQNIASNKQRAVLASGAICVAISDFQAASNGMNASFSLVLEQGIGATHASSQANALRALCMYFQRWPEKMMDEQVKGFIKIALSDDSESLVRSQVLDSLCRLLELNEQRIEEGSAQVELEEKTSRSARVMGDQDASSSLTASLVQTHSQAILARLFDSSVRVRVSAVLMVGTMLRQGLINPLQCIEPMVALETDDRWVMHHTAHQFLADLDKRHPGFLKTRVVQGMLQGYEYSTKVAGHAAPKVIVPPKGSGDHFVIGPLQPTFSVYSRLYRTCIATDPKQRLYFLNASVALFFFDSSLFAPDRKTGKFTILPNKQRYQSVKVIEYVAETLATLPYTLYDEPLFLVYHINRLMSLYGDALRNILDPHFAHAERKGGAGQGQEEEEKDIGHRENTQGRCLEPEHVRRLVQMIMQLAILLNLKQYLKSTYNLTDARCAKFNPGEAVGKNQEKSFNSPPKVLAPFPKLEQALAALVDDGPAKGQQEMLLVALPTYRKVVRALVDDADDLGNVKEHKDTSNNVKTTKKRKSKKQATASRDQTQPPRAESNETMEED